MTGISHKLPGNIRVYLFLLSLMLLTGCIPDKPRIDQCWFYVFETNSKDSLSASLTPASFLCIQKDGHYTRDLGVFDYGSWEYDGKKIKLSSKRNQSVDLAVLSLDSKELTIGIDGETTLHFDSQLLPSENAFENPYALENNQWRIPAEHRENDETLRKRLSNHCRFWETYFSWALKTKQNNIDVRSTPTPIKIYGNGFALKNVDDEPGRWRSFFFNDEDCKKANDILLNIFNRREISMAHTDNKYKMFIGAFQQLETALK